MKAYATIGLSLITLFSFGFYFFGMKNTFFLEIGIYDPTLEYAQESRITIENVYVSWDDPVESIKATVSDTLAKKRTPILTLEPWQNTTTTPDAKKLLIDVNFAKYDKTIESVCTALSEINGPIIIRWGHEMELKNDRYPWSNGDPIEFKNAYKRFVDKCRAKSPSFKYMWSPAGDEGSEQYYPGDEYVDVIGLSVYSFEDWEIKNIGHHRTFKEIFEPKYNRVKQFNKPVYVAEMGTTGDEKEQTKWLNGLVKSFSKYPLLNGVVYFNSEDVEGVWGEDTDTPNWHITPVGLLPLFDISVVNRK
jgi:beta-mannanase